MLLSHTQHHGVLGVAQLQNCHLHIGNGVTRLVEMVSSCFVQVRVPNISQMLLTALMNSEMCSTDNAS